MLLPFATTSICKTAFSALTKMMTKYRWRLVQSELRVSFLKCCHLLQQHIYAKQHFQHLPNWWPNTDEDLCKVNCVYLSLNAATFCNNIYMQNSIFSTYQNDDQIQMKTCAKWIACIFLKMLLPFATTSICKTAFSALTKLMTKYGWRLVQSELRVSFLKCCYLLQQHLYAKQYFQHLPKWWPNTDEDLSKVNCVYLSEIYHQELAICAKANTSLSLNVIIQCKYWMRFSLNIFVKFHFYLYGGPQDFIFIYMLFTR